MIPLEIDNNVIKQNTSRLFLLSRLLFVFAIILLIAINSSQFSYAKDSDSVDLYLDISFNSNLFMNKYDVSLELDGEKLDTIEYDSYYTKLCKVKSGKHVIRVYKDDEREVMGEESVQVPEDTTFQCKLKTKGKEIEFEESTTIKGTAGHSIEMPDCVGMHIVDALELLEQKGYVNCHYESATEEKPKETTWTVDIQNIEAGKKIDKNDEIILTCIPAEEYVQKSFPGLSYSKAMKHASAIGYKNIQTFDSRDADKQKELKEDDISDKSKKYWKVTSAEDNYSDDNKLILNFTYNVKMPDLSGKSAKKADEQLEAIQQGHFDYSFVGYKTGKTIKQKDLKKYKIVKQSIKPGTIIKYQSTITIKCKKTEAAREAEKKAIAAAKAKAEKEAQEELERKLNAKVWYTNTGNSYHTELCWHLRTKNGPITQKEAIKMGKEPCVDCIVGGIDFIQDWKIYK